MMWLLARGAGERVLAEHPELTGTIHRLTTAHLQWHLERKLPTLEVLDQV